METKYDFDGIAKKLQPFFENNKNFLKKIQVKTEMISQQELQEAIKDYNQAAVIAPPNPDDHNKFLLETMEKFDFYPPNIVNKAKKMNKDRLASTSLCRSMSFDDIKLPPHLKESQTDAKTNLQAGKVTLTGTKSASMDEMKVSRKKNDFFMEDKSLREVFAEHKKTLVDLEKIKEKLETDKKNRCKLENALLELKATAEECQKCVDGHKTEAQPEPAFNEEEELYLAKIEERLTKCLENRKKTAEAFNNISGSGSRVVYFNTVLTNLLKRLPNIKKNNSND